MSISSSQSSPFTSTSTATTAPIRPATDGTTTGTSSPPGVAIAAQASVKRKLEPSGTDASAPRLRDRKVRIDTPDQPVKPHGVSKALLSVLRALGTHDPQAQGDQLLRDGQVKLRDIVINARIVEDKVRLSWPTSPELTHAIGQVLAIDPFQIGVDTAVFVPLRDDDGSVRSKVRRHDDKATPSGPRQDPHSSAGWRDPYVAPDRSATDAHSHVASSSPLASSPIERTIDEELAPYLAASTSAIVKNYMARPFRGGIGPAVWNSLPCVTGKTDLTLKEVAILCRPDLNDADSWFTTPALHLGASNGMQRLLLPPDPPAEIGLDRGFHTRLDDGCILFFIKADAKNVKKPRKALVYKVVSGTAASERGAMNPLTAPAVAVPRNASGLKILEKHVDQRIFLKTAQGAYPVVLRDVTLSRDGTMLVVDTPFNAVITSIMHEFDSDGRGSCVKRAHLGSISHTRVLIHQADSEVIQIQGKQASSPPHMILDPSGFKLEPSDEGPVLDTRYSPTESRSIGNYNVGQGFFRLDSGSWVGAEVTSAPPMYADGYIRSPLEGTVRYTVDGREREYTGLIDSSRFRRTDPKEPSKGWADWGVTPLEVEPAKDGPKQRLIRVAPSVSAHGATRSGDFPSFVGRRGYFKLNSGRWTPATVVTQSLVGNGTLIDAAQSRIVVRYATPEGPREFEGAVDSPRFSLTPPADDTLIEPDYRL